MTHTLLRAAALSLLPLLASAQPVALERQLDQPSPVAPPPQAWHRLKPAPAPPPADQLGTEQLLHDPDALVRFIEANPERIQGAQMPPDLALTLARLLLQAQHLFTAQQLLAEASAAHPEDLQLAALYVQVLTSLGQPAPAIAHAQALVERQPEQALAHYLLARALLGTEPESPHRLRAAIASLEQTLRLAPNFQDAQGVTAPQLRDLIERLNRQVLQMPPPP